MKSFKGWAVNRKGLKAQGKEANLENVSVGNLLLFYLPGSNPAGEGKILTTNEPR